MAAAIIRPILVALACALTIPAWAQEPAAPCPAETWRAPEGRLPKLLGKPRIVRGADKIVDFNLDQVAPAPTLTGRGGITSTDHVLAAALSGCSDSPSGERAQVGARFADSNTGLVVEITQVADAGRSGRDWPGVRCAYRVSDAADPARYVDFAAEDVPAFNALTGLWRLGDAVYATFQFNGYAKEIGGRGNRVVAGDLCTHRVAWRSKDLTSNAAFLVHGDYLVTGYGFTRESRALFVLDRRTGAVVQKVKLPKSPEDMRIQDGRLWVRLYDGYASFPLLR